MKGSSPIQQKLSLEKYILEMDLLGQLAKNLDVEQDENDPGYNLLQMTLNDAVQIVSKFIDDQDDQVISSEYDLIALSNSIAKMVLDVMHKKSHALKDIDFLEIPKSYSLNESKDITKSEIKSMIKDELDKAIKKIEKDMITQKDMKDVVRKTLVNLYKYLWEKSAFFINRV